LHQTIKTVCLPLLPAHFSQSCRFIRASRPDTAGRAYRLATAFPPQQLDDDSLTIEAAGLANSVIIQK
jgi:hypothetical protein